MSVLDEFSLAGKTAIVTGATRGIGEAIAYALADAGANIVVGGRDAAAAEVVAANVESRGVRARVVLGELIEPSTAQHYVDETLGTFGSIDVLVNNAGICIHRPSLDIPFEEWRAVMGVNVDSVWLMSQAVGRAMVAAGSGSIINIGSMSGYVVNVPQFQPAYNASKAAVHHLTKSLAVEWAPHGVRVNAIAPGYIKTDMSPVDQPEYYQPWVAAAPQQRYAMPEELGGAAVFLASNASSFMTGEIMVIDGGYSLV